MRPNKSASALPDTAARPQRILYLVKHFPCLSQTFIRSEISALTRMGQAVSVVSAIDLGEAIRLEPAVRRRLVYLRRGYLYRYGAPDPVPEVELAADAERVLHSTEGPLSRDEREVLRRLVSSIETDPRMEYRGFLECLDVAALIRERSVDHIHCDFAEDNVKLAWLVSRATGVPFSFKMRAYDIFAEPRPEVAEWAAAAKRVVTISRFNRTYISRHWKIPPDRIDVVYDGIDLDAIPAAEPYRHMPFTIVSVARLVEKKGLELLVDACAQLARGGLEFRWVCVGDGPLRLSLEAAIARHGLGNRVTLAGNLAHDKALDAIAGASVFVLPCVQARNGDRDATPNTLLEAMALRRPIVSTRFSGIPELIEDDVDGLLVEPGDPKALAWAIGRLASDRVLADRLRHQARATVERRFRIERTAAELLSLIGYPPAASQGAGESR